MRFIHIRPGRRLKWKVTLVRGVSNLFFLLALFYIFSAFNEVVGQEIRYRYWNFRGITFTADDLAPKEENKTDELRPFKPLFEAPTPLKVEPASKDFGIIIEKIGVNAPVVEDVSVTKKTEYLKALDSGVAHAAGSDKPGESGNTYLFAHSSLDWWNYGPYAGVFNLIRKLETGDRIVTFYKGKRFDYEVVGKEIVPGFDTTPLARTFEEPYLTLQTCDPPGVAINRMIILAKLVK